MWLGVGVVASACLLVGAAGLAADHEIRFDRPTSINHIVTMEDIRHGHIVRAYRVDAFLDGEWKTLVEGSSIGYKKIDPLETIQVEGVRLRITAAVDEPVIRSFAVFEAPGRGKAEKPANGEAP